MRSLTRPRTRGAEPCRSGQNPTPELPTLWRSLGTIRDRSGSSSYGDGRLVVGVDPKQDRSAGPDQAPVAEEQPDCSRRIPFPPPGAEDAIHDVHEPVRTKLQFAVADEHARAAFEDREVALVARTGPLPDPPLCHGPHRHLVNWPLPTEPGCEQVVLLVDVGRNVLEPKRPERDRFRRESQLAADVGFTGQFVTERAFKREGCCGCQRPAVPSTSTARRYTRYSAAGTAPRASSASIRDLTLSASTIAA